MSEEYAIATDIDVANLALMMVGADTLMVLNDANKRSIALRRLLPISKREILEAFPWSPCLRRVQISPSATPVPFGWSYSFALPPQCVKPWFVNGVRLPNKDYAYEGRKILANTNAINLIYVAEIPYSEMPQSLISAIAARLAMNAAITIGIGDKKLPAVEALSVSKLEEACDADRIGGELERASGIDDYALARLGWAGPLIYPTQWADES
jgi:hypothetical protein